MLAQARIAVARWLEEGSLDAPWTRALSRLGAPALARGIARPLTVPEGLVTITVGGATLGGSGKTRVALACTRALALAGRDVVLVGHGHRARTGRARVVDSTDSLADVGDEALACARSLASDGSSRRARVVVGRSRQDAIDFVAQLTPRPELVVIDGPLQLRPRRSSLAILAVDREAPWGSGRVAPAGDLRASPATVLAQADRVVEVDASPVTVELERERRPIEGFAAHVSERGLRVGLFTALARPQRLLRALGRARVPIAASVSIPDHGPMSAASRAAVLTAEVDLWLATEKCATHLDAEITSPIAILRDELDLDQALVSHMRALTPARSKA